MPSDKRTAIVVAVLALVGAIGAAVVANWDKPRGATQVVPSAAITPPKSCRDKSHGIEKYQHVSSLTMTSSPMGGGFNQVAWCNQAIAMLRAQNPDGDYAVESSSESSRSTCPPFNCPQYTYTCTVRASTEPLYKEKVSDACR